jgi:predicted transcriptional regulator YdeE/DNA-binding transcriptional MerR regulator
MLKIGDFSKLAQVSIKTLRHYGKLGLLRPAWVDRFTSYRYYALDQLPRLNRILALKDLGFSLEQIGQLLRDDLSAAELRAMLKVRRAELEQHIQAEQARLARIEARLRQIEQEGVLPQYEVVFKSARPQRVVGIRDVVPGYHGLERLFGELGDYLQTQSVPPEAAQPRLAVYYDAEYHEGGLDVEAAAPAPGPLPGTPRVLVHQLPGVETLACVVHSGPREDLGGAYSALAAWIEANGYRVSGPNRDVYLQGPAKCVTEVQFPVQKKPRSIFMTQRKEKTEMEPKIVTQPAFTVVGMLYHGKNQNDEIAQMWQEFNPRMEEIKHVVNSRVCYGVCGDLEEDDTFKYVAGFEVSSTADVPEGMVSWQVPEQKYAVFPCTLPTIHQAYEHAFQTWLPQSGYQRAQGPDFELYGEDFEPQVQDSNMHIYIPIE